MKIFFIIVAILLIISGIIHLYNAITHRTKAGFTIGKRVLPFWITKLGAAIFIIALGVYTLVKYLPLVN